MIKRLFVSVGVVIVALIMVSGLLLFFSVTNPGAFNIAAATNLTAPTVTQINPTSSPNNLDTMLTITGTDFTVVLSGTEIITSPQVYLGKTLLQGITWITTTELTAIVPWGVDAGVYTLTVVNPAGDSAMLSNAFTVTQAINVWTTGGPYGGTVVDIAVHPVFTQSVFTVISYAGQYQSHDGGRSWEHTILGPGDRFSDIAYGTASPTTLYVYGSNGLWASKDDGVTWQPVYTQSLVTFTQHPTNQDIMYISRWDEGILRTEDGGESWENRSQGIGLLRVRSILINPATPTTLYATTDETHLYKSTDEGLHWSLADPGVMFSPDVRLTLVINPFDSDDLWLLGKQLNYSDNGAQSWITVPITYEIPWTLSFNPLISGTLYAGAAHDLLVSSDGGENWDRLSEFFFDGMIQQIRLDPASGRPIYLGSNGGGFYRSVDQGETWEQAVQGIAGIEPRAVVPAPNEPNYVYLMTVDGVFYSNNSGHTWVKNRGGETHTVAVDPTNHLVAYGTQWGPGQIAKTGNGGISWSPIEVTNDPDRYISALTIYPTDTQTILVGGGSHWGEFALSHGWLSRSEDGGDTWQELSVGQIISEVTSIVIDPLITDTLYIGTCTIHPYWNHGSNSGVYKSTDGGTTWNPANTGLADRCVRDLVIPPENHHVLFAAINDPAPGAVGIYNSVDGGANWSPANTGLDNSTVLELAIDPLVPSHLYAATWRGLFYSINDGQSWQRAVEPMGSVPVFSVSTAAADDRTFLYIGTVGGEPGAGWREARNQNPSRFFADALVDAGVYQMTINHRMDDFIYLPLIRK